MRARVASAGTGKTTSLVLRYLELIRGGTPARRIAAATFTRSSADELRGRLEAAARELLESGGYLGAPPLDERDRPHLEEALRELGGSTVSTIHGLMVDALRVAAPILGLDPGFEVMGEWEARIHFEEEVRSLLLVAADPAHPLQPAVREAGERATEQLMWLFAKRSLVERFRASDGRTASLLELYDASQAGFERRLAGRWLGPGEIERWALRLIASSPAMARVTERFKVVLVDEFQDVNPLQGRFLEALEARGISLEVVGDPKQSIYGFRNADVEVFRRVLDRGERLPPLAQSYRHGRLLVRFLNRLTATLSEAGLGFSAEEAPQVVAAGDGEAVDGPGAAVPGEGGGVAGRAAERIEVHWLAGEQPMAELRESEAEVLAERLAALHRERGIGYHEMAVLARSHHGLTLAEAALRRAGLPALLGRGRGYYGRIEVRDLYNALRAGTRPVGLPFAAWLRGPFGRLMPADLGAVLGSADPEATLARVDAAAALRYRRLRELVLLPPLEALKRLIRERSVDGRSYLDFLDARQRLNVDALLFAVAGQAPATLELLLQRLDSLSRQGEAGEVPRSGDGVALLTVHAAKGLEFRLAAVFDLGRGPPPDRSPLRVDPESGLVYLPGPGYREAGRALLACEEAESYRLLYVAATRAREVLLLTGSVKGGRPRGWVRALELMGLGPDSRPREGQEFRLAVHPARGAELRAARPPVGASPSGRPPESEWMDRTFSPHPLPPTFGPSRLGERQAGAGARAREASAGPAPAPGGREEEEPLAAGAVGEFGEIPGLAAAVGTLVHYAIGQDWDPEDPEHLANLRAQEVMFPFAQHEQEEILGEVRELLANYRELLGRELPHPQERRIDEAELPIALPQGATVWQGVIDRLYRVRGRWYLDDYKTDRKVEPGRYLAQLAIYAEAVRCVRGVTPRARLVYLRSKRLVPFEPEELAAAYTRLATPSSEVQ